MNETLAIKQTKFSNGEISPSLYGDITHPKYPASLRGCLNWLPIPQGALVKRSGFGFIAPIADQTVTGRLIPYVFSDGQTFVLEFGNQRIRFYQLGRYVGLDAALHTYGDSYAGGYYELSGAGVPWTTAMLPYLKTSQVGDVITITYGGQAGGATAPMDLRHTPALLAPWTIGLTPLKIPAGAVTWTAGPTDAINAWSGVVSYNCGDRVKMTYATGVVEWVSIQNSNLNNTPPAVPALNSSGMGIAGNLYWMPAIDLSHQGSYEWVQTVLVQDANGITYESAPSPSLAIASSLSLDRPRQLAKAAFNLAAGYTFVIQRLYRRVKNGTYGFVLDHPGTTPILDDGRAPDYTRQPPAGTDPFLVNGADSYPSVIGYLDQRRLFAASGLLPATIFMSKVGDLYNYDNQNSPGADTDALMTTIASEVSDQIRAFVPMRRGLLMTSQGEWAIAGQGGGPVSRSSLDVKRQSRWGSSWLNPIGIGTGVLFNTAKNNMVRDLYPLYGLYADIWDGQDLSVMARHFLDLHTIKAWAFQSTPYPVVWIVRDDGVLLSLTYQHAPPSFGQQLTDGTVAWAQHTTGVGSDVIEDVCVVPEPPQDAVYVIVKRTVGAQTKRYIERLTSLICPASPYVAGTSDVRYGAYLDSAISYDGHSDQLGYAVTHNEANLDSVLVPGSTALADYVTGRSIKIKLNTFAVPAIGMPFVISDGASTYGSAFVFDPENSYGLGTIKAHITGYISSSQVFAELDQDLTQAQINNWSIGYNGGWSSSSAKWAIAKGLITAAHLNGYQQDSGEYNGVRGVICLADGDVQVPGSWANGTAGLQTPAVVIQIGIAYNADISMLDAYHPNSEIRNKFKNIVRMGFEVAGARDLWVGKDFANLDQWQQRQVLDAYNVMGLQTGYFEQFVTGEWSKSGQAVVRHFQPLPVLLTSILREIRLGDS